MEYCILGNSTLSVSRIGLGCMTMSGIYGKGDDAESIAVIQHALDLGLNFIDSSDMYGWGQNEELLGRALKGRRDQAVVTTKFGQKKNPSGGANLVDGRPEYVAQACEASLKRLGVDVIDLYYQHRVDPKVPIEETVGAMKKLVEQGKVRFLGLCEAAPATIRHAHAVHPISALQSEYSLLYRTQAEEVLPTCHELGISFIAYSPLGRGLLTGQLRTSADLAENDRRRDHPRFQGENFARNLELVHRIDAIAKQKKCTSAQLVLAWFLAREPDIVPIPGTKHRNRVDENLGALTVQLSRQDMEQISGAIPPGAAAGSRYPEPQMKAVYL
jgi:aryl-alcohol dehydrogenase-like predicted oxidoreductase